MILAKSLHIEPTVTVSVKKFNSSQVICQIYRGSIVSCKPRLHGLKEKKLLLWHLGKQIDKFECLEMILAESLHIEPRVTVSLKYNNNS